jgi:7-cyano-7-deazaguanine synthase
MPIRTHAIVVLSGGQDSTTCLFWALKHYNIVEAITFAYGQKHKIEVDCARELCDKIGIKQTIVDMSFVGQINDSAMIHNGNTSEMKDGLPASFVPNRNALMLTLAHMYAQKVKADYIVTGVCQTDYSGYPDCRLEFISALEVTLKIGSKKDIKIHTPLMYLTKAETFQLAEELECLDDVIRYSHTCYEGDHSLLHIWGYGCGICPACQLRKNGWEAYKGNSRTGVSNRFA